MTKTKKGNMKGISKRSLSRLMAVQTLYQKEYKDSDSDILIIMDEIIDNYLISLEEEDISSYRKKIDIDFLTNLINGILLVLDKIDEQINEALGEDRNFDQIPDVMLQILRFGTFELQFMKHTPFKVIINEYVDIANAFYEPNKVNFVNAILDKISKNHK
jgi:N utilization substance protein B